MLLKHEKVIEVKYYLKTTPEISKRMRHVKSNRGPSEIMLSKALWARGLRYRLNYKKLPGSPDIAITKYKIAIFIDGEFWHGYYWEKQKAKLKSNREYWISKIEKNIDRDMKNDQQLKAMGWEVIHFGDKEVKQDLEKCVALVLDIVREKNSDYDDGMYKF